MSDAHRITIEATVRETRTVAFCFFRTLFRRSGLVSEYFRAEMNVTEPERWPQSRRGPLTAHGFVDGARQAKSALAIRPFL
jgi:hypothetical protein